MDQDCTSIHFEGYKCLYQLVLLLACQLANYDPLLRLFVSQFCANKLLMMKNYLIQLFDCLNRLVLVAQFILR